MNETKTRSIADFEREITNPHFFKYDDHIKFVYTIYGKHKTFTLATKIEVAQFFVSLGIIKHYSVVGTDVRMYENVMRTYTGEYFQPVQYEEVREFTWAEIDQRLSTALLFQIAAENEWSKTVGKVIKGSFEIFRTIKNAI